jgi:hypothetical protein
MQIVNIPKSPKSLMSPLRSKRGHYFIDEIRSKENVEHPFKPKILKKSERMVK